MGVFLIGLFSAIACYAQKKEGYGRTLLSFGTVFSPYPALNRVFLSQNISLSLTFSLPPVKRKAIIKTQKPIIGAQKNGCH